ncbi:SRPBCC family protein [Streptomyces sp. NPDC088560]|uniref:SRPBCC family protein n=1 Tax=Streptomyces sp. NPDC088560 TaxID=3365868 RepID=UPI0038062EF4
MSFRAVYLVAAADVTRTARGSRMLDASDSHPDIHWPSGFSPGNAHSFCQAQAVVHASPATAFALLSDVTRWPEWVPGITEASSGQLDRMFKVQFHGHQFEIYVGEHVPPHRLGWSGVGAGVQLYQAWLLTAVEGGTHVVTENVVRGPTAKSLNTSSPKWAQRLNSLWLAQLRRFSESAPDRDA